MITDAPPETSFKVSQDHEKREFETQVNMARGIISHSLNLKETELIDMSNILEKQGMDPNHIGKFFIEMANRIAPPSNKA